MMLNQLPGTCVINVQCEPDISRVVRKVRSVAAILHFNATTIYYLATVASELANNLYFHAGGGDFYITQLNGPAGIELTTIDHGLGIDDIDLAISEGYSTSGGLGCGLAGVKRLMDSLTISSLPGKLTTVSAVKWC